MSQVAKQAANGAGNSNEFERLMQKEVLPREVLQMKMENETIMAECRARPRDMAEIKRSLEELMDTFPDFAEDVMYCKPVGKERGSNQQKYATGLSIRAAEALAEAYGYNRVRSDVEQLPDGNAKITATFTDFQSGRVWQDSGIVSRTYKSSDGHIISHNEDRFWGLVVKSEKSKLIREAITRSVNSALKAWLESEANKRCSQRCDDATVNKIVNAFRDNLGVPLEKLEKLLRPRDMGWNHKDLQILRGLFAAIRDKETTIAEAFPEDEPPASPKQRGKSPKSAPFSEATPPPSLDWNESAFRAELEAAKTVAEVDAVNDKWEPVAGEMAGPVAGLCDMKRQTLKGGA
jgi:hypothetical protein